MRQTSDFAIVAHAQPGAGKSFTCNERYTVDFPHGVPSGESLTPKSTLLNLKPPSKKAATVSEALSYCVNR